MNKYFTYAQNIEGCLRNGSFVRTSKHGLVQYTNGDFMGDIENVPANMVEVDAAKAESLLPSCCLPVKRARVTEAEHNAFPGGRWALEGGAK